MEDASVLKENENAIENYKKYIESVQDLRVGTYDKKVEEEEKMHNLRERQEATMADAAHYSSQESLIVRGKLRLLD